MKGRKSPVSLTHIEQVRDCSSDFRLAISFLKRFFSILPVRSRTVLIALLLGVAAFSSIPQSAAGVQMIVSKSSVDTREGFKPALDVGLSEEPSADVIVTAMSGDISKLTVSPASLTIKPGQHPEGEDNDPLGTGICYFSLLLLLLLLLLIALLTTLFARRIILVILRLHCGRTRILSTRR